MLSTLEMELRPVHLFLLTLSLSFATLLPPQGDGPTPAQVEQAHQLLNGEWEIISLTDDGETLGRELVAAKLAEKGRLTVSGRSFRIVNPETGEAKVTPFRVNPAKIPKQISLTSRDDRTIGGIYKFDGDDLVVCVETFPDTGYPSDFEAPAGSNRTLVRMRMVRPTPKPVTTPTPTVITTPEKPAATAIPVATRRPTESELERVRELFSGNWQIESISDDGENLGPELIRQRFAQNGRIRFGTRALAIVNPKTEERRVSAYRLDPSKTPSEIDVTTQFDTVLKGIYRFEGDRLSICLAKHEENPRPKEFTAEGGSDRMLLRLKLAKPDEPVVTLTSAPVPVPVTPATPTPEELARKREATIRRLITGSWTMSDSKGLLTTVFQPDGSFVATRTWSRSSKRLFGPPSDSSNGTWTYQKGLLSAWVSSTTDARIAGHQINVGVQSIGDDTMVVTDPYGSVKTFRRLR